CRGASERGSRAPMARPASRGGAVRPTIATFDCSSALVSIGLAAAANESRSTMQANPPPAMCLLGALLAEAANQRVLGKRVVVLLCMRRREAPRDSRRHAELELVPVPLVDGVHHRPEDVERFLQRIRRASAQREQVLANDLVVMDE